MIDQARLEHAMQFLADTGEAYAVAKTDVERQTYLCKHQRALRYEMLDAAVFKSVEDRKMAVERCQPVVDAEMRRLEAVAACEKLRAKRETEVLVVEVWRSLNASRRQGNIV